MFASLFQIFISASNPSILVSIQPLKFIVQEITQDQVEVHSLAAGNISAHTFEPKPSDIRRLEEAQIAIYVSPELDSWMLKHKSDKLVTFMDWIPKSHQLPIRYEHSHEEHHGHHEHTTIDPHFWMDPIVVQSSLPLMTDFLCKKFEKSCPQFKKNSENFHKILSSLDQKIRSKLLRVKGRPLMSTHDFLNYFCSRYELDYLEPIEPIPGKEPSPKDLLKLKNLVTKKKLKTIFSEPQLNEQNVRILAEASGLSHKALDPQGVAPEIQNYESLLIWNTDQLASYL